jgi:hypothetical protein
MRKGLSLYIIVEFPVADKGGGTHTIIRHAGRFPWKNLAFVIMRSGGTGR